MKISQELKLLDISTMSYSLNYYWCVLVSRRADRLCGVNCSQLRAVSEHRPNAGCSKWHSSKAAGSSATEAYPCGTLQGDGRLRTMLGAIFSILLRASVGTSESLLKHCAEAEVGDGVFEV